MQNDYSYRLLQQEVRRLRSVARVKNNEVVNAIVDIATIADNCPIVQDMELQRVVQNLKNVLE